MSMVLDRQNETLDLWPTLRADDSLTAEPQNAGHSSAGSPGGEEDTARSDEELIDRMDRLFLARVKLDRALMREVAEAESRGLHERDGFETMEQWVATHFGMAYGRSEEFVRVASCLDRLPALDEAFQAGRISYDHLRWLTRVATPESERELLTEAEGAPLSHTYRLVKKIEGVSTMDSRYSREERYLEMKWDMDRRFLLLNGLLPEEQGSLFEKAINSLAKQIPDAPDEEFPNYMPQKRADALAELAGAVLSAEGRDVKVMVHVDAAALMSGAGVAEIDGGPNLSTETARRLCCDSLIQEVANNVEGKPIAFGRSRRTVTPRMLQQLRQRDHHCRWPGCRRKNLLDAHHVRHWVDGGPTDFDNLLLLCKTHHYLVHEGGYSLRGDPPHVWLERPSLPPLRAGPPWARMRN